MSRPDVVVIGGGIAGLATTWRLAVSGARPVLLEREPLLAAHASGRNAAIFRQIDGDLPGAQLAQRTRQLLPELGGSPLLDVTGAVYVGDEARLAALAEAAREAGVTAERFDAAELRRRVPALEGGEVIAGILFPGDGVLDLHALMSALTSAATSRGAEIRTRAGVRGLKVRDGKLEGVVLETGEELLVPRVVMAAGAWTAELGRAAGLPLPIVPRRRHLAMLVSEGAVVEPGRPRGPVVWRLDEPVYFRPETGGVLASPCDEEVWAPGIPPTAPEAMVQLADRLSRLAPELALYSVRSAWACLRSFAPDGGLVAGVDPRLEGLTWVAGLGGRGMSSGLGLGEVAAAAVLGQPHALAHALSPARLLFPAPSGSGSG